MAAPIAHIFLALQMLAGLFCGLFDEKEFIIGTSFPDIRYLNVISREATHVTGVTLDDILQEKNSFKAGMLFHSFVDEQRELFIVKHHFYDKIPHFKFATQSLKFAEDEILKMMFDTTVYSSYFDEIMPEERAYSIDEDSLRLWHTFLQNYCNGNYSAKELIMQFFDFNQPHAWRIVRQLFLWTYARKVEQSIAIIKHDKKMVRLIVDFYGNFAKRVAHK